MNYNCEICDLNFSTKQRLNTHTNSEKHKHNLKTIEFQILENKLKDELKEKQELKLKINELDNKVKTLEDSLLTIKNELLSSDKKAEEYRKIVEKCASKTTTTNVVNNNKNTYNHLNYISSEPINFRDLKHDLSKVITAKSMFYDDEDFNNHIINNILKDENGKDKVLCTDINRKNFSYKDENSGELISDPELENLRERLRKGVDIKIIRQELLDKLILKYQDNPNVEPYEKLYFLMDKLEFGDPFVVQVAKKTYIKTKTPLCIENV